MDEDVIDYLEGLATAVESLRTPEAAGTAARLRAGALAVAEANRMLDAPGGVQSEDGA